MKISDLHTHPSLKPFQNKDEPNNTYQNIWNGVVGRNSYFFKVSKLIRNQVKETSRDSQSNLNEFIGGDVQTAAVVIHPIERGWFMKPGKKGRRFWKWIISLFLNREKLAFFTASLAGIPLKKAEEYIEAARKNKPINYFEDETTPEYNYIASQQAMIGTWAHQYEIVKDFQSYQQAKNNKKLPLFLSVEGGHALLDIPSGGMLRKEYKELDQSQIDHLEQCLEKNIEKIKGKGTGSFDTAHTPIYMTLVHMYQNFLAGHCRSYKQGKVFAPGMSDLLDQKAALNGKLTDLGRKAIEILTSDSNGSRILIDVKHLSVKARNEYYQIAKQKNLPVIGSHIAMAGVDKFPDNPSDSREKHDNNYFSKWSINFSDEDARIVHETDGIMGIALHEGRMPGGLAAKKFKQIKLMIKKGIELEELLQKEYLKLAMSNIFQIIYAIGEKDAWKRIMIGSDYDGIMNPFDIYPKTSYFRRFIYDMREFLENPSDLIIYKNSKETRLSAGEVTSMMYGFTAEEIADMIAIKNFEGFIERHY